MVKPLHLDFQIFITSFAKQLIDRERSGDRQLVTRRAMVDESKQREMKWWLAMVWSW